MHSMYEVHSYFIPEHALPVYSQVEGILLMLPENSPPRSLVQPICLELLNMQYAIHEHGEIGEYFLQIKS